MRILSWNINSVRLRQRALARLLRSEQPDVVCLQETKVPDELFPLERFRALGYRYSLISGQKGYHGVAILSRVPLRGSCAQTWCDSTDRRHVHTILPGGIELHNVYAPAGGDLPDPSRNPKFAHKLRFFEEMSRWFGQRGVRGGKGVLVGDLNIAPLPNDVWSHRQLRRIVTHTEVEIEHLSRLMASVGWVDGLRRFVPDSEKLYTWWSYRASDWKRANKGRRLDHAWVTPRLSDRLEEAVVLERVRGWRVPSDHAPIRLTFSSTVRSRAPLRR